MGSAASAIPMHIDKETFRKLSGGTINDAIFDSNAVNGLMSRDKLIELANMRDCFLSHDFGIDINGRNGHDRVGAICRGLRGRGVLPWYDDILPKTDIVQHVTNGINKSRSLVCFLTKSYVEKVVSNSTTDHCNLEFNYTLSKKHPQYMIPVVCEESLLNPATWPGNIGLALSQTPFINFVDDNNFDAKIEELARRILSISRAAENLFSPAILQHNSILTQTNKPKEEQQFFQWLARSTNIEESRRIIYCASFVKAGVSNVFTLAKVMNAQPNFLASIGVNEYDADEIALAVRDLGLGYAPVRDFDQALNLESVIFALRKSSQAQEDPTLAESALSCVARVAASNPIMPKIMAEKGICEAILKLMQRNLAHQPSMEHGCAAVYNMALNNPEISAKFGDLTACDILPRTLRSHLQSMPVVFHGCGAISVLALIKDNRHKFSNTGACDVVIKAVPRMLQHPEVLERCFQAANHLCVQHPVNVGKLGVAGACDAVIVALEAHPSCTALMNELFQVLVLLALDSSNRTALGAQERSCRATITALNQQLDHPMVLQHGATAVATLITGNAYNRNLLGAVGACEVLKAIVLKYPNDFSTVRAASRGIFALAAGNLDHKQRFAGILPILQAFLNNRSIPDDQKTEIRDASLKV
jgi:hypothetical protein